MKQKYNQSKILDSRNLGIATVALILGLLALIENPIGQFSDIRGMYVIHLNDGQHQWPLSYHTLLGAESETQPLEYPALTGLIVWLFSFFVQNSDDAKLHYYWISALVNSGLFALSSVQIRVIAGKKASYFFIFSLAVAYSLHRNWDIWAVVALLFAVIYFESKRKVLSALWLALAIALKFFPIVLLLPIFLISIKGKDYRDFIKFLSHTIGFWALINFPFALINLEGWFYFYRFSFEREIGSGSIFEAIWRLGIEIKVNDLTLYLLNLTLFFVISLLLTRIQNNFNLSEITFLSLFAFTLFNKQYSMQYIIWLTPFAVIAIQSLSKRLQSNIFKSFIVWQISELIFQYFFFTHILTYTGKNNGIILTNFEVSDSMYGMVAIIRYICITNFAIHLIKCLQINFSNQNLKPKSKKAQH